MLSRRVSVKERYVLRNHSNGLAQRVLGHILAVLPVDQDRSGLRVIKTLHQRKDSRFPGSGRADDTDPFSRLYFKAHRCEDGFAAWIGEAYVAEFDGATRGGKPARSGMLNEFMRHQERAERFGKTRPMLRDVDQGNGQVARGRKDR